MLDKRFHVGIIPDGARRWAKANSQLESFAYIKTMEVLIKSIKNFYAKGATSISVYLSSKNNIFNRTEENKSNFLSSQNYFMSELIPSLLIDYDIEIIIAGKVEHVPLNYQNQIKKVQKISIENAAKKLYLLIAYSPLDEIDFALKGHKKIETKNMWVNEELDLVFRTGVKGRISDFLPIQSAYAELVFIEDYFPNLTSTDIDKILNEYNVRKRRFGH